MMLTVFVSGSDSNEEALQEENCEEDESVEGEVERHVPPQGTIRSCCFTFISFSKYHFTTCQTNPLTLIENSRKISSSHLKHVISILTIFVSDSDSKEEALQVENCEEDESVEGEVERHVPPARFEKILLFYLYQFF